MVGRLVKWWFPARFFGLRHQYGGGDADWKREQAAG
jgi:hypothetical protein